jgi:hypothetical protein
MSLFKLSQTEHFMVTWKAGKTNKKTAFSVLRLLKSMQQHPEGCLSTQLGLCYDLALSFSIGKSSF